MQNPLERGTPDSNPNETKVELGGNGAHSSHDESNKKSAIHSPIGLVPLSIAEVENDHNSSAGGGDPIDTSKHSAGAFGAVVRPQNNRHDFIFDVHSESTENRPSITKNFASNVGKV